MKILLWYNFCEKLYPQKFYRDRSTFLVSLVGSKQIQSALSLTLVSDLKLGPFPAEIYLYGLGGQEDYLNVFAQLVPAWLFLEAHLC